MKYIASLIVILALMTPSENQGINALSIQQQESNQLLVAKDKVPSKKSSKKTTGKKAPAAKEKKSEKDEKKKSAKKTEKKEEPKPVADEEKPEDDAQEQTKSEVFNGADEMDVIENIYDHYAKEAVNAAGDNTGEKIIFKEDALKASAEVIEAVKGLKGTQLTQYMKKHFDTAWKNSDINDEGEISLEEAHTFQRSLMGKLNQFAMAPGTVGDITTD